MVRTWPTFVIAILVAFVASFAGSARSAHAEDGWRKLGDRTVNGKLDRDVIAVGGEEGVYSAIRVKVEASSLEMYDLKVTFGNGESFSPKTRLVFDKNTSTRVLDLPGAARVIKNVEFKYGNLAGGGNARVELWGKAGAPPPPVLKKLGERTVNGKIDKDAIDVGGGEEGTFTAIQVRVEQSSIELYDVKVVFANGESFSPNTRLVFAKDTATRLIDLPGNKRAIKRVEFRYGNLPGGGSARVELWGKR